MLGRVVLGVATALFALPAFAEDSFYKGKTIIIVTSAGPGGLYDVVARSVARHMPSHIPGQPNMIVQNMPGAGHVLATNHMYNLAPKDGTTIATLYDAIPLHQTLGGAGVRFDARDFNWLGAVGSRNNSIYVWHTTGIKTFADVRQRETIFGSTGAGSGTALFSSIANNVLGAKFKLVSGYKTGDDMDFAMERGEIEANSSGLNSLYSTRGNWIAEKKIIFIAQIGSQRDASLPDVPLLIELADSDEQREIIRLISSPNTIGRSYTAPPGVSADRLATLRQAFGDTMADPAFKSEMANRNIDINPKTGEQVARIVTDTINTPPAIIAKAKAVLPKRD